MADLVHRRVSPVDTSGTVTFWPSTWPVSLRPLRNAAAKRAEASAVPSRINATTGSASRCPRAVRGHATAAPPRSVMNWRRCMCLPRGSRYMQDLNAITLRPAMSALGQKRTFAMQNGMSALTPKADMCSATRHVRFVPIADIRSLVNLMMCKCFVGHSLIGRLIYPARSSAGPSCRLKLSAQLIKPTWL